MRHKVWSVLPLGIIAAGLIGIGWLIGSAQEDDLMWNCYLKGNHSCGSNITTGFVNLEVW